MFNAKQFFEDYDIHSITKGKNVQRGWINIKCPFHNDKSEHLGFNYEKGYFNCWHCKYIKIIDLIKILVPNENPYEIKKNYETKSIIRQKLNENKNTIKNKKIIVPGNKLQKMHKDYLINRNFDPDYLEKKYKIKGTNHLGDYKFRIIAPIYYKNRLISYQGRDITNLSKQRYKACKKENEIIHHKHVLYNFDSCKGSNLVAMEGIFDVLRFGDSSICTFGSEFTPQQVNFMKNFKRIFIFFDPDKGGKKASKSLSSQLTLLGCEVYNITGETDPGEMKNEDIKYLRKELKLN